MKARIPPLLFGVIVAIFGAIGGHLLISEKVPPLWRYRVGIPSLLVAIALCWWAFRWKNSAMDRLFAEMRGMPAEERAAFFARLPPDLRREIDRLQRNGPNQSAQTNAGKESPSDSESAVRRG